MSQSGSAPAVTRSPSADCQQLTAVSVDIVGYVWFVYQHSLDTRVEVEMFDMPHTFSASVGVYLSA